MDSFRPLSTLSPSLAALVYSTMLLETVGFSLLHGYQSLVLSASSTCVYDHLSVLSDGHCS